MQSISRAVTAIEDDPEAIFRSLAKEVGQCGQQYEIWEPRMIRAIAQYVHAEKPLPKTRTALWGKMGYGANGPSPEDLAESGKQEAAAWDEIRREVM